MKKSVLFILALCLLCSSSFAARYALVGGIRSAFAGGLMVQQYMTDTVALRGGVEITSGYDPICAFVGGKFLLTYIGRYSPLSLGLGAVGFFGNTSDMGISISGVIDRLFDVKPLFMEFGADIAGPVRLMLQVGYYF